MENFEKFKYVDGLVKMALMNNSTAEVIFGKKIDDIRKVALSPRSLSMCASNSKLYKTEYYKYFEYFVKNPSIVSFADNESE